MAGCGRRGLRCCRYGVEIVGGAGADCRDKGRNTLASRGSCLTFTGIVHHAHQQPEIIYTESLHV